MPLVYRSLLVLMKRIICHRIDLDIENGSPTGYGTFVGKIRRLASDAEKRLATFYLVGRWFHFFCELGTVVADPLWLDDHRSRKWSGFDDRSDHPNDSPSQDSHPH